MYLSLRGEEKGVPIIERGGKRFSYPWEGWRRVRLSLGREEKGVAILEWGGDGCSYPWEGRRRV